ncbi:MAG: oxygen-independent coproporphyrinogen III oxidase [Arenicellales bacterium]|nr:oxygen-independent coproporphyrinogen III oxidase [Arenicellales bacterium]MDP6550829.1 oxygen-independent coproporphyrinogen III oxidase [Arenicellales bacterium]MDP6919714.1 oxygen-independent coproporphyrinogen III oxidase [Arenicellales bacterium]
MLSDTSPKPCGGGGFPPPDFDPDLIRRYDRSGPRYTSYPTALQFTTSFDAARLKELAQFSNEEPVPRALSLYVHIPFCSTLCFYCACNKIVTRNVSRAVDYLERLHSEVAMYGQLFDDDRELVQLHLGGGTPTFLDTGQIGQLLAQISGHFRLTDDSSRDYSIEIDPRTVSPDTLDHLREIGFNRISMGVQDFDPAVQKAIHREQPCEETLSLIRHARARGFRSTNVDLIYGLPLQTVSSFITTLDRLLEVTPDRLSIFHYAHLPHLFAPQQRILESQLPDSDEKLRILGAAIDRLSDAGYVYIGMDHFAREDDPLVNAFRDGTLHRNFQGYSTHAQCDLIGVGVSAISHIGNSYSQNTKALSNYQESIGAGKLPVDRGLELSRDDEIRQCIIEQLMCAGEVNLNQVLFEHRLVRGEYFANELEHLQPLVDDGLVTLPSPSVIRVTRKGRYLLRNICMIFDRYIEPDAETPRHSRVL